MSLYADLGGSGISGSPRKSIPAQGQSSMAMIYHRHDGKKSVGQGLATLPPPSLRITFSQRHWARYRTPCGGMSTLGHSPGTHSKNNVLSMLLKPKFLTLPTLQSLSCYFMLLNSAVLQSQTVGLIHCTAQNINGHEAWWSEARPAMLPSANSMAFSPSTWMEFVRI